MSGNYKANNAVSRTGLKASKLSSGMVNPTAVGAVSANPSVPASTVDYTSTFKSTADVYVVGGTVTAIIVGGVTTGVTSGIIKVPAGAAISITYSVAPTWKWFLN